MALADYRLCDVCGKKAFYDSNLNYEFSTEKYPISQEELIEQPNNGLKLENLGKWAVLCKSCSKTHEIIIKQLEEEKK